MKRNIPFPESISSLKKRATGEETNEDGEKTDFCDIQLSENINDDTDIYKFTSLWKENYRLNAEDDGKMDLVDTYRFSKVGYKLGQVLEETENFTANSFACGDVLSDSFGLPILKVKKGTEFQNVSLPITDPKQATDLIELFSKAPYGKGVETVLDEKIRRTWQLEPSEFRIDNPNWEKMLLKLIETEIKPGLGVPSTQKVCHSIYKLLLYETDGHFDFHRDTEKADRMFATLTIMLPSVFTDGHLIVKQGALEKVFKYENDCIPYYTSFYCDCEHKVTPITSGYRLCLVYNLCFDEESAATLDSRKFERLFTELENIVSDWITKPEKPIFSYLLDHMYNIKSLKKSNLKGNDVFTHRFLEEYNARCKPEHKIGLLLGIYEREDSGDADSDFYITDDDDDGENHSKEYDFERVHDSISICRTHKKVDSSSGTFNLISSDFIPNKTFKHSISSSVTVTRYGNDGVQFEMLYSRGCLLIYPIAFKKIIQIVKHSARDNIDSFQNYKATDSNEQKQFLIQLAKAVIHSARFLDFYEDYRDDEDLEKFVVSVNDPQLSKMFQTYFVKHVNFSSIERYSGIESLSPELADLLIKRMVFSRKEVENNIRLLKKLGSENYKKFMKLLLSKESSYNYRYFKLIIHFGLSFDDYIPYIEEHCFCSEYCVEWIEHETSRGNSKKIARVIGKSVLKNRDCSSSVANTFFSKCENPFELITEIVSSEFNLFNLGQVLDLRVKTDEIYMAKFVEVVRAQILAHLKQRTTFSDNDNLRNLLFRLNYLDLEFAKECVATISEKDNLVPSFWKRIINSVETSKNSQVTSLTEWQTLKNKVNY